MTESSLAFQSSGSGSAATIVFLHGGGAGAWMWQPVAADLQVYHLLIPDLPEHGGSRSVAPFSMPLAAEKVAELIRSHAHGGRASVVGLSEGAQVAVQLLALAPELVENAVISSALLRPIPGMGMFLSPALLGWTYRASIPPFRNVDWWIRLNMKYSAGIPDEFFPQFKADFQAMSEAEFVNLMIANQTFRLPAGLDRANVPTLVLAGWHEYRAMKQSMFDLLAVLPNAQGGFIRLEKRSTLAREHNWALTAPGLFALTVRAWIEGAPLPAVVERVRK